MFTPKTALFTFVTMCALGMSACQPAEGPAERAGTIRAGFAALARGRKVPAASQIRRTCPLAGPGQPDLACARRGTVRP